MNRHRVMDSGMTCSAERPLHFVTCASSMAYNVDVSMRRAGAHGISSAGVVLSRRPYGSVRLDVIHLDVQDAPWMHPYRNCNDRCLYLVLAPVAQKATRRPNRIVVTTVRLAVCARFLPG